MFSPHAVAMLWLPLILFFSVWSAHAKDDGPRITPSRRFETPLFGVQYFEDSNVILAREERGLLWRSADAGAKWSLVDDIEQDAAEGKKGPVLKVWMHPFDNERAYALGANNKHWMTVDRGASWKRFSIPDDEVMPSGYRPALAFHAGNRKKVIFNGQKCESVFLCEETSFYTTNDFKDVKELNPHSRGCIWAHATSESHSERMSEDKDDDRIICIERGEDYGVVTDNRLVMSDDFFVEKIEPKMDKGRKVKGIVNVTVQKGYIITAAKSPGSSELSLFVTVDGEIWHRGVFPAGHKVLEEEYTVLESTNYSLQVDVMNTNQLAPMGVLFSSNSNGTYFTENIRHTNRSPFRIVDFEKIQGIQGIIMVNTVKNWQEVERDPFRAKQVESRISFDDGRSWKDLEITKGDDKGKRLHLHSVTEMSNTGRVFSSPAPGIVMGVGNTGDYLRPYEEGNVYVSNDAGLTWRQALVEPHKYEFGDQGTILVAVPDKGPTVQMTYSLDHGKEWFDIKLDDDPINVALLTTVPDSTTQKFIFEASKRVNGKPGFYLYAVDFSGIYDRQCEDGDFEPWWARRDEKGEPDCLMGRKQKYRRRKADVACYVGKPFKEAEAEFTECSCTWEDYECDTNFKPDEGTGREKKCIPTPGTFDPPDDVCPDGKGTFKARSGFRKIPGNKCTGSVAEYEEEVDRPCDQLHKKPAPDGKVQYAQQRFRGAGFGHKLYLEKASQRATGEDETIIMSTLDGSSGMVSAIYRSADHGKNWEPILEDEENIQRIIQHPSENDRAFFLSPNSKEVVYTIDRGENFKRFKVEEPMTLDRNLAPLSFHPTKKDTFLWTGRLNCEFSTGGDCHNNVYLSEDRGDDWKTMLRYSEKCEFITEQGRAGNEKLLYCVQHEDEKREGELKLRSSDDFFGTSKVRADDVLNFATMSEFIIAVQRDPESNLKVKASVDGTTFADAHFPKEFNVPFQTAYTLLDSSTHAVFLHVTVGNSEAFEYGRIMKSNSNGTSYVLSVDGVNRNFDGYVDFEKMQGVEGVAMVNVVTNINEESSGKAKKLKSLITHNDGSEWLPIQAPAEGPDGIKWKCDVSKTDECSLHLHSYTERDDPRSTFSSPSAIGLMMGVGNVGQTLGSINDIENVYTFISRDAGISWKAVRKGRFKWEYGDQGSVIAIVEKGDTNVGYYTLDEGENWREFEFNEEKVQVQDLSTVPSDNSKQFLIWVRHSNNELGTINVDFSNVRSDRLCKIDEDNNHADDDYYLWSPKHPSQDSDCLFGHTMKYHRKKPKADCWNGPKIDREQHGEREDCACTAQDFEW